MNGGADIKRVSPLLCALIQPLVPRLHVQIDLLGIIGKFEKVSSVAPRA